MARSKEFEEKKEILSLQNSANDRKHLKILEELKYKRESEQIFHEHEMERQRIKTAEIKKMQIRKEQARDFRY